MNFLIIEPTVAVFQGSDHELQKLKSFLTYTNTSVSYLISKHMKNKWFKQRNPAEWAERLNQLKVEAKKTLVFEKNGLTYIRPGSLHYLKEAGFDFTSENHVIYPDKGSILWKTKPAFEPYEYQAKSVEELIKSRHGSVSLCTGAGKTFLSALITKNLGLETLVVVPSKSIFLELLHFFETHFGKNKVGAFGNGKKDISKQITVAIGKSLTMIEEDSPEHKFMANKKVLILDECHQWASTELEKVCHNIAKDVPYRFSMTGTQTRGDGAVKLLQSITGPVVYELSTKDGIEGGFLSPVETRIITVGSKSTKNTSNPGIMKQEHFLYNPEILEKTAQIVNALADKNETSLILVEEIEQIAKLAKLIKVPFGYIHGNTTKKEDLKRLGIEKSDLTNTLLDFNMGKIKVLIGTDCISTGTNIFCHNGFNLQGGASEIGVKQGIIGRMVRRLDRSRFAKYHPPKKVARLFDFKVQGVDMMERHLATRVKFYEETGGKVFFI